MNLYNLYESVILEEVKKQVQLITEGVSETAVNDAINNKYNVNITYDDYPNANPPVPPSKRYIQVYNYADTKANNKAVRAFQINGGSKTTDEGAWKMFRLDRIRSWRPTKKKFYGPVSDLPSAKIDGVPTIPAYKDGDKSMSFIHNKVVFNK